MNRTLYNVLLNLCLPLLYLRLFWRGRRAPAYLQRKGERFARTSDWPRPAPDKPLVHFHAVSVGEVHAAEPLVRLWMQEYPGHQILITTSTPTGSARVKALFGDTVLHVYLPYDVPRYMQRFLAWFSPRLTVILETELWPGLLFAASELGIHTALVNARLSEKSARGYQRIAGLTAGMLKTLGLVCAQSAPDGERFTSLGLPAGKLQIVDSLKYDIPVGQDQEQNGREMRSRLFGDRPVVIAASTREGEDEHVLAAFTRLRKNIPEAVLVLVPRHPERFSEAGKMAERAGFRVLYRSSLPEPQAASDADVLVGDSLGEMFLFYGFADIAFVGGSLVDTGCQNILEPAALGLPVVTGPSLFNFQAASEALREAGGQCVVSDAEGLASVWHDLLGNAEARRQTGERAQKAWAEKSGASKKLLAALSELSGF